MWLQGWSADEADGNEGRRVSFSGVFLMYSCCQKSPSHPSMPLYSLSNVGVYVYECLLDKQYIIHVNDFQKKDQV